MNLKPAPPATGYLFLVLLFTLMPLGLIHCGDGSETDGLSIGNGAPGGEFGSPNGETPGTEGGTPEGGSEFGYDPPGEEGSEPGNEFGSESNDESNGESNDEFGGESNDEFGGESNDETGQEEGGGTIVAPDNPWDNPTPPTEEELEEGDCNPFENTCDELPSDACEEFLFGFSNRPVDIVFTIDQSGSMDQEIYQVREKMNAFANYITTLNVDYHVVLVANSNGSNHICIPEPLAGPDCTNGERFHQINETIASHNALGKTATYIDEIESFMREKSVRHFVVITDDTASSPGLGSGTPAEQFHNFILARPGYDDYLFHGVIGMSGSGCTQGHGANYIQLAEWTGGLLFNICLANWDNLFIQLGETVATANTQFLLDGTPHSGSIAVTIDGVPVTEGFSWSYSEDLNAIELIGALPADDTPIEVCYIPLL